MKTSILFELANQIVREIYPETITFPYKYQNSLGSQLRRASLSVVLNLVEGGARKHIKERRQFNNIAYGSLKETKYLLILARDFRLLNKPKYNLVMPKIERLAALLYGLVYRSRVKIS